MLIIYSVLLQCRHTSTMILQNMETDTETAYYQQSPSHTTTNMSSNNNNCTSVQDHHIEQVAQSSTHPTTHAQPLPSMCSYHSHPPTLTVSF